MSANMLKEHLGRQPFEPFCVCLSNGDKHEVRHPENGLLYKAGIYIATPENDGAELAEDVVWCSLLHVAAVEPVANDSANGTADA